MSSLKNAEINVLKENPSTKMKLKFKVSDPEVIRNLLQIEDLTLECSPDKERNIIKRIYDSIIEGLNNTGFQNINVIRDNPVISAQDNFDNLLFSPGNTGRSSTYTRYTDEENVLRTHTSAQVPSTFRNFSTSQNQKSFTTFVFSGLVYRRDVIDPRHLDAFHQIDVWTLQKTSEFGAVNREDLLKLVDVVFKAACPDAEMIYFEAKHPYTIEGIEVYAKIDEREIEVLECGLIHPEVLIKAGLDPNEYCGLALGMGVERLIMARKLLPDIRLIRSSDPRVLKQMNNLNKFTTVSNQPAISRDMSYAIDHNETEEDICENIRKAFSRNAHLLEEVIVLERIEHLNLHPKAQEKLGTTIDMDNALVRIILRHPDITLTREEANDMYQLAYPLLHIGNNNGYPQ